MSQFKVPQNIDMQDRIIGPLTLFQFLYLLGGGMIFYITLKTPGVIDLLFLGLPVGLFSLALAFIKINDQPFGRFVVAFIYYLIFPKTRVWHHGGGIPKITVNEKQTSQTTRVKRKELQPEVVSQVAGRLDKDTP